MGRRTEYSDLVNPNIPGKLQEIFKQVERILGGVRTNIDAEAKKIKTSLSNITRIDSKNIETLKTAESQTNRLIQSKRNLTEHEKEYVRIKKQIQTQLARQAVMQSKEYQQLQKLKASNKELSAQMGVQKGSIRALQLETNKLVKLRANLDLSNRKNVKTYKQLTNQIRRNTNELKKHDALIGRHQRNVGNYTSAFRNLGAAMGISLGAYGIFRVIRNSLGILSGFQEQMSKVRAVTGATAGEIKRLELDAMRLGRTTPKTASEVAALQYEFAKLGFTTQEILNATEATIQLSIAAGSDLARAAEVAGATVRGFGLDAADTQLVVDVMAKSFSSSALNLERFAESMKYVAPIAKVANLSLEETTAMLSKLADAGIHGSMAGTGLRMIISKLDKTGKGTAQSIKDLAEKGLDLAAAQAEVGQRAKTALLVLADQTEQVDKLTEVYKDASGAAKEMADIMQDNVVGATKRLQSAWEGFILTARKSNNFFMLFLDMMIHAVEGMTPFDKASESAQIYNERLTILTSIIKGMNDEFARKEIQTYILELDELIVDMFNSMEGTSKRGKKLYDAWIEGVVELQNYLRGLLTDEKKLHELTKVSDEDENDDKEETVGIINILNERMKTLRDLKNATNNPAHIAFYNKEIEKLQDELKYYNELGKAIDKIAPKLLKMGTTAKEAPPITAELKYIPPTEKTIFQKIKEYLGFDRASINELADASDTLVYEINNMLAEINAATLAAAERELEIHENKLDELKDKLEKEKELKDEGKANDYDRLITQIAEEKKARDQAAKDLEAAQKREAVIQFASQTGSMITATANTIEAWSKIPFIGVLLGLAQVAYMIASFTSYKSKIKSLEKYEEGGEIKGKSHRKGGKIIEAEGGEFITNKQSTKQSKSLLEAINKGKLTDEMYPWILHKDKLPDKAQEDSAKEVIYQLERQERIQQETLDYMKGKSTVVNLGKGKVLIMRDNYVEIATIISFEDANL